MPQTPERIVSLAPSHTEILFALGLEQRIVGVTDHCDYPLAARLQAKVGGWLAVESEKVAALRPDLVLTASSLQDKIAESLKKLGLRVERFNPVLFEEVCDTVLDVGGLTGRQADAYRVVKAMRSHIRRLRESRTNGKPKLRVYVEEWSEPPTASGNWVSDLALACGAQPFLKSGEASRPVEIEELKKFDPEVIVLSWCGYGERMNPAEVYVREGWQDLRACSEGNVFVVHDSLLTRPGPRLSQGAQRLARILDGAR
ncbi:MAG: cobalamin-binding protein [Acidobacteriota bacterium]|nr:MAG: cobalamin-binding protein [Acidobacteriota bacterium]